MDKKNRMSSIVKKLIMAVTGGGLVFFLLFHGTMNIVSIFSPKGYQKICEFLGANWYAIIGTICLVVFIMIHFIFALILSWQNYKARGTKRYIVVSRHKDVSWASKNMLIIGIVVITGLILHLSQFWYKMQWTEMNGQLPANGIDLIRYVFNHWFYSCIYLVWLIFLWLHLSHGIASVMQSLGWNSLSWKRIIEVLGKIFASIIVIMFASVVVYYWLIY